MCNYIYRPWITWKIVGNGNNLSSLSAASSTFQNVSLTFRRKRFSFTKARQKNSWLFIKIYKQQYKHRFHYLSVNWEATFMRMTHLFEMKTSFTSRFIVFLNLTKGILSPLQLIRSPCCRRLPLPEESHKPTSGVNVTRQICQQGDKIFSWSIRSNLCWPLPPRVKWMFTRLICHKESWQVVWLTLGQ